MNKKIIASALAIVLLISLASTAFATDSPETEADLTPRYSNFSVLLPSLSVNGTTARCGANISGYTNVTSITVGFQLQALNSNGVYVNYGSYWSDTSSSSSYTGSFTKTVDSGKTYRLRITFLPNINGEYGSVETSYSYA
jgi:hypothetical protein